MEQAQEQSITWSDFMKVEMRVGTIISAEKFKEVRNPAYKMLVDFGAFGVIVNPENSKVWVGRTF